MRAPAVVFVLAGLVIVGLIPAVTPVAGPVATATGQSVDSGTTQTIYIDIQDNGDARVAVTSQHTAEGEAERAAFERLSEAFVQGEHTIGGEAITAVVDEVAAETDRTMTVEDRQRSTNLSDDVGTLRYEFTWTAFAASSNGRIEIGDAFHVNGHNWVGTLGPDQRLVIERPEGYLIASTTHPASDRRIIWEGPTTFDEQDIQVTYRSRLPINLNPGVALAALLVAGVAVSAWWLRGRDTDDGSTSATEPGGSDGADQPTETESEPASSIDPELLSDEERVERLLKRNGGRMKQSDIVEETGWSSAKVSQLLSEMDQEDRIDKLRIGRENLIALPEENITEME